MIVIVQVLEMIWHLKTRGLQEGQQVADFFLGQQGLAVFVEFVLLLEAFARLILLRHLIIVDTFVIIANILVAHLDVGVAVAACGELLRCLNVDSWDCT